MVKEYVMKECFCPVESASETISTIIADQAEMGYKLLRQTTATTSDNAYTIVIFCFYREEDEVPQAT